MNACRDNKGRFLKGVDISEEERLKRSIRMKKRWESGTFTGTKGIPATAERKKKVSESMKGKMPKNIDTLNKNKIGAGNPMFGKTTSLKQKEVVSKLKKGIPRTAEVRKKLSIIHKQRVVDGLHNSWKGGVTPENKIIRRSLEFKFWREAVFKRDNWTCVHCGKRGVTLHPDHIKPFAFFPELRFDVENGRTLCVDCHKKTDTYGRKSIDKYGTQNSKTTRGEV